MATKKGNDSKKFNVSRPRGYLSMREAVVKQLKKMGFSGEIKEAENVAEALKIVETNQIQFIISDWNLPDGTGFEFLKSVRKMPNYIDTPFLMVTTENGIKEVIDAIKEGASNYLIKPWEESAFIEKLLYAWEKHQT